MPTQLTTADTALCLADFTQPGLIVPHLSGQDTAAVILELSGLLQRHGCVPDLLPFYQEVINREFYFSTVLDQGWAFPHARVNGLTRLSFALGRCDTPLDWIPKTSSPVRLVFLFAVPATDAATYILLRAGLGRFAKEAHLADELHKANDTEEMLDVLRQFKLHGSGFAEAQAGAA